MLFVIADGDITGAGNPKSTPDLLLDMIEEDLSWGNPQPFAYLAVGAGKKRENMARIHIGHYCKRF
jgi:chitin synthase